MTLILDLYTEGYWIEEWISAVMSASFVQSKGDDLEAPLLSVPL